MAVHDRSKCIDSENETRCCGQEHDTTCADGFVQVMSDDYCCGTVMNNLGLCQEYNFECYSPGGEYTHQPTPMPTALPEGHDPSKCVDLDFSGGNGDCCGFEDSYCADNYVKVSTEETCCSWLADALCFESTYYCVPPEARLYTGRVFGSMGLLVAVTADFCNNDQWRLSFQMAVVHLLESMAPSDDVVIDECTVVQDQGGARRLSSVMERITARFYVNIKNESEEVTINQTTLAGSLLEQVTPSAATEALVNAASDVMGVTPSELQIDVEWVTYDFSTPPAQRQRGSNNNNNGPYEWSWDDIWALTGVDGDALVATFITAVVCSCCGCMFLCFICGLLCCRLRSRTRQHARTCRKDYTICDEQEVMESSCSSEDSYHIFLLKASVLRITNERLPPSFQELSKSGWLACVPFSPTVALSGSFRSDVCVVSHPWQTHDHPDPNGEQFRIIREHLDDHLEIKYVWYDYCCLPRATVGCGGSCLGDAPGMRLTSGLTERLYLERSFDHMPWLYLAAPVLVILDDFSPQRFWLRLEAYLASHEPHPDKGLVPGHEQQTRFTCRSTDVRTASVYEAMFLDWRGWSSRDVAGELSKGMFQVTLEQDRTSQCVKLMTFDVEVKDRYLRKSFQEEECETSTKVRTTASQLKEQVANAYFRMKEMMNELMRKERTTSREPSYYQQEDLRNESERYALKTVSEASLAQRSVYEVATFEQQGPPAELPLKRSVRTTQASMAAAEARGALEPELEVEAETADRLLYRMHGVATDQPRPVELADSGPQEAAGVVRAATSKRKKRTRPGAKRNGPTNLKKRLDANSIASKIRDTLSNTEQRPLIMLESDKDILLSRKRISSE